jgi:hypothetical protein
MKVKYETKTIQKPRKLTGPLDGENIILRRGDHSDVKDINRLPVYNSICI